MPSAGDGEHSRHEPVGDISVGAMTVTVIMCYDGWFEFAEKVEQNSTADSGRLEKKLASLVLISSHEH